MNSLRKEDIASDRICIICGHIIKPEKETNIDHIIPVVRGGTGVKSNKCKTHVTCNSYKTFLTLAEYKVIINHMDYGKFIQLRNKVNVQLSAFKQSRPDVSDVEFDKVIRFFLELSFPCLREYADEEKEYIKMYHPKIPLRWDNKKTLSTSKELSAMDKDTLKEQIFEWILSKSQEEQGKLNKYEIKSIFTQLEKFKKINLKLLSQEEIKNLDELENLFYRNKGYVGFNSVEISLELNVNATTIKTVIRKLKQEGKLKCLCTERNSFVKPDKLHSELKKI